MIVNDDLLTGQPEGRSLKNEKFDQTKFRERLALVIGPEKPFAWAKRLGISSATFSRIWNNGATPKVETLLRISRTTGVSLDWLMGADPPATSTPDDKTSRREPDDFPEPGNDIAGVDLREPGNKHGPAVGMETALGIVAAIYRTSHLGLLRLVATNLLAWEEMSRTLSDADKTRQHNGEIMARLSKLEKELSRLKRLKNEKIPGNIGE